MILSYRHAPASHLSALSRSSYTDAGNRTYTSTCFIRRFFLFRRFFPIFILFITIRICTANEDTSPDTATLHKHDSTEILPSLNPLTVTASRKIADTKFTTAVQIIDSLMLSTLPGTALDINRALTVMPFATGQFNTINNNISVRGGGPLENVYIVNGIEMDDISHFSSLFNGGGHATYIDPHSVDRIEFDGGAFSAALPPRLSSAITLHLKKGDRQHISQRYNFNVAGVNLSADGPLPAAFSSFYATMRYVDMQIIKKMVAIDGYPKYGDMLGVAEFPIGHDRTLTFTTLTGIDHYREDPSRNTTYPDVLYSKSVIQSAHGIQYQFTLGGVPFDAAVFGTCRTTSARDSFVDPDLLAPRTYRWDDRSTRTVEETSLFRFNNTESSATGGITFNTKFPVSRYMEFHTGLGLKGDRLLYNRWYNQKETTCTDSGCTTTIPPRRFKKFVYKGRSGGFLQCNWEKGMLSAVSGIRYDYWHLLHSGGLSPRCGVSLSLPAIGTFSISGGMLYQEPANFNGIVYDLSIPSGFLYWELPSANISDISLQRCKSAAIEYRRESPRSGALTLSGYIKQYDRQYPYTTPYSIDYATYFSDGDKEFLILRPADGQKEALGVEFMYTTPSVWKHFSALVSHTFYSVKHRYKSGHWIDDINNLRNKFDVCFQLKFLEKHTLSVRITWHEGRPYTPDSEYPTEYRKDPENYFSERFDPMLLISPRYNFSYRFSRCTLDLFVEPMNVLNTRTIVIRENYWGDYKDVHATGLVPIFGLQAGF